jgi:hypothetical protein
MHADVRLTGRAFSLWGTVAGDQGTRGRLVHATFLLGMLQMWQDGLEGWGQKPTIVSNLYLLPVTSQYDVRQFSSTNAYKFALIIRLPCGNTVNKYYRLINLNLFADRYRLFESYKYAQKHSAMFQNSQNYSSVYYSS